MSSYVIWYHLMSSNFILCQVLSYCNIPFIASNISYILNRPTWDIAGLSNFLITYLQTLAISRGAFAPKNIHQYNSVEIQILTLQYNTIHWLSKCQQFNTIQFPLYCNAIQFTLYWSTLHTTYGGLLLSPRLSVWLSLVSDAHLKLRNQWIRVSEFTNRKENLCFNMTIAFKSCTLSETR